MDRRNFLALVGLTACARRVAPAPSADAATADASREEEEPFPVAPPALAGAGEVALRPFGEASRRLADALWPALCAAEPNPVWSPALAVWSLGLLAAMARSATAARVHGFLGLTGERAELERGFAALARRWSQAFDAPGFAALGRPFVARGARLDDEAKARLRGPFAAPAALVTADGNEGVRERIEHFFHARTGGMVGRMIAPESLVADVPAHLAAVARASLVVRGRRASLAFRVGGVTPVDATAVVVTHGAQSARVAGATLLRLPLRDEGAWLDLLVPDAGERLEAAESRALGALLDAGAALTPASGPVLLPAVETAPAVAARLRDPLWAAGLSEPFDPERSPLAAARRAWVSELFHLVRAGWAAADPPGDAVTGGLRVDRPFTWALRDQRHGALLAMGRVYDPRA
jgi:hypothetical protein